MEGASRGARANVGRAGFGGLRNWKLEDAKAKYSEVVRRARDEGPQRVTHRGRDAVVVVAVDEFKRLLPAAAPRQSLVESLGSTALGELAVRREADRGRDLAP